MSYDIVLVAYSSANFFLSLIIFFKSHRNQLSRFYFFCVNCLVFFGIAIALLQKLNGTVFYGIVLHAILFLYAIYPFLFIHFVVYLVRHKKIVKSLGTNIAIYVAGLFSYAMLLWDFIQKPVSDEGLITQSGSIFYLTWLSVFFAVGIAMLFEILGGFKERFKRANIFMVGSMFLLLILPGPFTDSIFLGLLRLDIESYFYLCTIALTIAVYFIFRHKIAFHPIYDALKSALSVMNDIFLITDGFFRIEMIRGKNVSEVFGYKEEDLIGLPLQNYIQRKEYLDEYRSSVIERKMRESYFDTDMVCRDGKRIPMNFSFTPIIVDEELTGFVSIGRDMTERKKLEAELIQAQKMESLGTLASGIAHDFNNLLQIMLLNTNSLERKLIEDSRITRIIDVNKDAIKRGSKLVQQILTFARKTDVQFESLQLGVIIEDLKKLLVETFPRTIIVEGSIDSTIPPIYADPNQLSQVLINLCVNARDAMPERGSILIKCEMVMGGDVKKIFSDAKEDRYVCLSLADTGSGMNENIRNRVFEPFFTTKETGKGTGLGLAVVYGIVTAHKGFIDVKSSVGVGTTFYIYLPVIDHEQTVSDKYTEPQEAIPRGSETILFVGDEDAILQSVSVLLKGYGYKIITAMDGYKALEAFQKHRSKISLIIMDIGLPKKSGWEVYQEIRAIDNNIKVIIASGYLDPKIKSEKLMVAVNGIISKPYDPDQMLRTIRKVLNEETRVYEKD